MKKIFFSIIAFASAAATYAQSTMSYKKSPTLSVNFMLRDMSTANTIDHTSLSTVIGQHLWTKIGNMGPGVNLQYSRGITDLIDLSVNLGGSFVKYPFAYTSGVHAGTSVVYGAVISSADRFLLEASGGVNFKLLSDRYFLVPYYSLGLGVASYGGTYYMAYVPTGLGLQFNLGQGSFIHTDFIYNAKISTLSTNNLTYSIGIGSPLNEKKETPKLVPPPPPPAPPVEKDSDKDGIVDSKDKCPDVPGIAKYDGCPIPDTDGDGINDENDKCPTVKGIAKYDGCPIPDTDHDGINDEEDKCPTVAGVARYQGCPIPDRDHDGINDEEDKCPDVPGVAANSGCPEVKEEVVKKVTASAKNIFFSTGSAKLLSKSYKSLDEVIAILKDDSALKLDIEGHTDNTGSEKINQPLSENRAKAVYDYIMGKGIDASRLHYEGFGSSKPIADNKTAKGRAMNRRVEMKPKYY